MNIKEALDTLEKEADPGRKKELIEELKRIRQRAKLILIKGGRS